ncbi:hypothetical protein [Streptomyces cavernae]|uniref:Pepco domain-containing protein n=1 Tax=Streptomyces cavernae TaxID=2259034 RepID=UPI000FEB79CF|nr:hypothetical protein [Streptomyces cavernae]
MTDSRHDLEAVPILVRVAPSDGAYPDHTDHAEYAGDTAEEELERIAERAPFSLPWREPSVEVDEESLRLKDLQASFERIQRQVASIMEGSGGRGNGFGVTEVTARLGVSAKGGLAFVAEAGIEASIEVKFVAAAREDGGTA